MVPIILNAPSPPYAPETGGVPTHAALAPSSRAQEPPRDSAIDS